MVLFLNCRASVYIFLLTDLLPMVLCECCSCVNSCLLHSNHLLYCVLPVVSRVPEFAYYVCFMNMKSVYMHGRLELSLDVQR